MVMERPDKNVPHTSPKRRWVVELCGDKNELAKLIENFSFRDRFEGKEPSFSIEQFDGQVFLQSQTFALFCDPRDVQQDGERLVNHMNRILKLQHGDRLTGGIEVGSVFAEEPYGAGHRPQFGTFPEPMALTHLNTTEAYSCGEGPGIDTNVERDFELNDSRTRV